MRKKSLILLGLFVALILFVVLFVGLYTIPPIGAIPSGMTELVWRTPGQPIFDSPDAICLRSGSFEVTPECRGEAIQEYDEGRFIKRLPYMQWAYDLSIRGK
jgi:hypothetical protein